MGVTGALMAGSAIMSMAGSIGQGISEKNQAEQNAQIYEQQAANLKVMQNNIDQQKYILSGQYITKQNQLRGSAVTTAASQGLKISGSTAQSISQSITQLQMEQSYQQYDLDMQKYNLEVKRQQAYDQAEAQRRRGRNAMMQGFIKAGTTALSRGSDLYSNYFGGAGNSINSFGTTINHFGSSIKGGWNKLVTGTKTISNGWAHGGNVLYS